MKATHAISAGDVRRDEWIPLLDTATREVFEIMLASQLSPRPGHAQETYDVTAMVGLAGQLCGVLTVRCGASAAALITSRMLSVDLDEVGPEVSDALGEVCNMVAGNFKNKITGLAEGCLLSPPTVITGSDYHLRSLSESPPLAITYLLEGLPVLVALEVHG